MILKLYTPVGKFRFILVRILNKVKAAGYHGLVELDLL